MTIPINPYYDIANQQPRRWKYIEPLKTKLLANGEVTDFWAIVQDTANKYPEFNALLRKQFGIRNAAETLSKNVVQKRMYPNCFDKNTGIISNEFCEGLSKELKKIFPGKQPIQYTMEDVLTYFQRVVVNGIKEVRKCII